MTPMHAGTGLTYGIFGLIWLLFFAGWLGVIVVFLVAVWRAMKAHESMAASAKEAVDLLRSKPGS